jgi:hypothetical protein
LVGKDDQLESAWPVPGSILVQNGLAYLAAGRSSYLDGGIVLLALEPRTGEVVQRDLLHSPDPQTGKMPPGDARTIPGALGDVLVGDGASVYLREQRVFAGGGQVAPGAHVFSTAGFRDPSWFNRTQWTIGTVSGADLLVFDGQTAYGVTAYGSGGRAHAYYPGKSGCSLFADSWNRPGPRGASARRGQAAEPVPGPRWTARIPLRVTAMALAGGTLLAAGPSDLVAPQDPLAALEGRTGGELWSLSATDGTKLAACPLDSVPVFDGLAATAGRLFLSTRDGHLVCLAGPSRR